MGRLSPNSVEDSLTRNDFAGVLEKKKQEPEFNRSKVNLFTMIAIIIIVVIVAALMMDYERLLPCEIDLDATAPDDALDGGPFGPAVLQLGVHAHLELDDVERLRNVVESAERETADPGHDRVSSREEDRPDPFFLELIADARKKIHSTAIRKIDIEKHEIVCCLGSSEAILRFFESGSPNDVMLAIEHRHHNVFDFDTVFNEKNVCHSLSPPTTPKQSRAAKPLSPQTSRTGWTQVLTTLRRSQTEAWISFHHETASKILS